MEEKRKDEEYYRVIGHYGVSALIVAIDKVFSEKPKAKYVEKPLLEEIMKNRELTQEEIDNRELQKMLFAEEMWAKQHKRSGLKETVIM